MFWVYVNKMLKFEREISGAVFWEQIYKHKYKGVLHIDTCSVQGEFRMSIFSWLFSKKQAKIPRI